MAGLLILVCVVFPNSSIASNPAIYTVGLSSGRPAFGNLVGSTSGTATFTETPAGVITASNGGDFDPHAASRTVSAQTITVNCGTGNNCGNQNVRIQVTLGTLTGRITSATMTATMGTAILVSGTTSGSALDFTIKPIGKSSSKNFTLGFTINASQAGTVSASTAPYTIIASGGVADTSGSNATSASAAIYKGLSLGSTQNLDFGSIVVGASSGTVALNALGTTRAATGGVTLVKSQASNPVLPALFSISGETGTNVTVSFTTDSLTGPGTTMTFAANSTVVGVVTLGSSATPVTVGGTVTVNASQTPGVYNGMVHMTVSYN